VGPDSRLGVPLLPELPVLTEAERSCLQRYVQLLVDELGENLAEVAVFGSVARGESWPRGIPIRSDLDLLVVTDNAVPADMAASLVDATLSLFLESGRQIGPQFKSRAELENPATEREARFLEDVAREAVRIWER
jgi:predicted nucleotidyltransferase